MTTPPIEAVVAGSRGFALALLVPLTERVGLRPRIAADPAQALSYCGPGGLVVVECLGPDTLRTVEALVRQGKGVRFVAALPDALASEGEPLRALGVDLARWDGTPADVLVAVGRQLTLAAATPEAPRVARLTPAPASPRDAPSPSLPAAAAAEPAKGKWPSQVPGQAEAEDALERALEGAPAPPDGALAVVGEVVASLSEIERAVLDGTLLPIDPEPIRRAAVMRVRVAAALATVPAPGEADEGAVSAFLAEIDALLSEVNALAASAPEDMQPALGAVRNALVREAIDLSEVAQGATSPAMPGGTPAATAPSARSARTRLVSIETGRAEAPLRRRAAPWVALAIAVGIGGGYHGWSWYRGQALRAARSTGVPAGMADITAAPGKPRIIVPATTAQVPDAADIARLKAVEERKGHVVRETDGIIVILPAAPAAGSAPARP